MHSFLKNPNSVKFGMIFCFQAGMFKAMPPLQRMPSSARSISSSHGQNEFDESPIKEDGEKYPRFMEGKYNMKSR